VIVAQVRPALARLAANVPAIQIAVGKLRLCKILDDCIDLRLYIGVTASRQRIATGFDPLANIGVPEDPGRSAPIEWSRNYPQGRAAAAASLTTDAPRLAANAAMPLSLRTEHQHGSSSLGEPPMRFACLSTPCCGQLY